MQRACVVDSSVGENTAHRKCDIVAATATFLTGSVIDSELTNDDWKILRRDRVNGTGGGVILLTRPGVGAVRRVDLETSDGEDLWAQIITDYDTIYVCVMYTIFIQERLKKSTCGGSKKSNQ
ncbi:hypothetical protein HW555_002391 [Spodoptera exigua]|uniref:Uncharacterized protein n=1 Tax=Spodoptera exigua TaxID=7107 RepID=A0A835GNT9_SPOEX|nr:hypothetical protein HW555_002391 [Spodoptera exigua]